MIIDTHAHYNLEPFFPDWNLYWQNAQRAGVTKAVVIGTTIETSRHAVRIAEQDHNLYACIGIHPTEEDEVQNQGTPVSLFWETYATHPKVVAIGECGLDYARLNTNPLLQTSQKHMQHQLLSYQTKIAQKYTLPMVIHCRDAHQDLLEKLHHDKVVLHCMSGNLDYLIESLRRGWYVSFAANVGYKNAGQLRALALATPLERILVETDAPFLPPQSKRGEINLPEYMTETIQTLADLFALSFEEFARQTSANAQTIFPKLKQ